MLHDAHPLMVHPAAASIPVVRILNPFLRCLCRTMPRSSLTYVSNALLVTRHLTQIVRHTSPPFPQLLASALSPSPCRSVQATRRQTMRLTFRSLLVRDKTGRYRVIAQPRAAESPRLTLLPMAAASMATTRENTRTQSSRRLTADAAGGGASNIIAELPSRSHENIPEGCSVLCLAHNSRST